MAVAVSGRGRAALGYYAERTHDLVDAPSCAVLQPELLATLDEVRGALADLGPVGRHVRHVDLRCGTDPTRQHLTLVVPAAQRAAVSPRSLAGRCRRVTGLSVNLHPGPDPQVIRGPIDHVWGEREVWVELPGVRLRVSPGSFFQVNTFVLPALHERMAAFLGPGGTLLDLYAGVGTHALALARRFDRVIAVEGVRRAVGDAKASAAASGLPRVKVVASPVEHALRVVTESEAEDVVLNPSRAGAAPSVLDALIRSGARRIAYLSCDPQTLARDLAELVAGGFAVRTVVPVDMMPQTRHVEALALLESGQSGHRSRRYSAKSGSRTTSTGPSACTAARNRSSGKPAGTASGPSSTSSPSAKSRPPRAQPSASAPSNRRSDSSVVMRGPTKNSGMTPSRPPK
jgi:23S rRNA (uracil1939-C5)-methyltransferase